MDITFYITVAGNSSRMKYDKANLALGEYTFLERMTHAIKKIGYSPILVTKESENTKYGLHSISDNNPQIGPLGGLYQSLKHAPTSYVCYLSCDIPLFPTQVLQALANHAKGLPCTVVSFKERLYPLIGIYHKCILPVITNQIQNGNYKMMDFLERINKQIYPVDAWIHDEILLNCNKPEDLEKLKAYFVMENKSPD